MISEMERLILKADVAGAELPANKAKSLTRKKSVGPPLPPTSPAPRGTASSRMSSPTAGVVRSIRGSSKSGSPAPLDKGTKKIDPYAKSSSSAVSVWKATAALDQEPADSETTKESTAQSDSTSVDDFFDGTANSDNGDDTSKSTLHRGSSFLHNLYMKRPEGLENMTEAEYTKAIDPQDDCKSLHPVAKEYLKAINTGNTPARPSTKSVGTIEHSKSGSPRASSLARSRPWSGRNAVVAQARREASPGARHGPPRDRRG